MINGINNPLRVTDERHLIIGIIVHAAEFFRRNWHIRDNSERILESDHAEMTIFRNGM